jgi:probable HAF family extracellular repeat protein
MLLIAGAGVMLAAMVAVMPATVNAAPPGQRYTWTTIDVPGSSATVPITVNDHGVVVGEYYATSTDLKNGVSEGFIKQGRKYTTIDDPLGVGSSAVYGMNDHGEIVGTYQDNSGNFYGFIDQGGKFTTIADPSADLAKYLGTFVTGVNDSGEIVGSYFDRDSTMHAFTYKNGRYTTYTCPGAGTGPDSTNPDFGDAGSNFGYVDNAGAMIGTCFEGGTSYYNYVYQNGRFNRVPDYPGSSSSWISFVTDSGESGGDYYTTPTVAKHGPSYGYVYQKGQFTTINDPLGPYGIQLGGANDSGAITAMYFDSSGLIYGAELTPSH